MNYKELSRIVDAVADGLDSILEKIASAVNNWNPLDKNDALYPDRHIESYNGLLKDLYSKVSDLIGVKYEVDQWGNYRFPGNVEDKVKGLPIEEKLNDLLEPGSAEVHWMTSYFPFNSPASGGPHTSFWLSLRKNVKEARGQKNNLKKKSGWQEVYAGINGTPCGVVNKEHTQFRPYVGPYFNGYDFYDKYKDWPFEDSEEAKRGLEELAKSWGVDVSDIKTGANDSWEGGYAYVEKKDLGKAIDIDQSEVEEEDGELWFTFDEDDDHDAVIDVYERLPEGDYWWWPCVNDQ